MFNTTIVKPAIIPLEKVNKSAWNFLRSSKEFHNNNTMFFYSFADSIYRSQLRLLTTDGITLRSILRVNSTILDEVEISHANLIISTCKHVKFEIRDLNFIITGSN